MKLNAKQIKSLSKEDKKNGIQRHEKPLYEFSPGLSGHEWKQQGPYLVCHSCEIRHATYIGMGKLLVGIEDGKPILERR